METIVRISKRDNPYVILDKEFLNNAKLSWRSKGLLAYFLSKPDNWKIIVKDVINRSTDGRDSVLAGIRELEKNGYVEKVRIRDKETGKYIGIEYVVYEKPQNPQQDRIPSTNGFSVSGFAVSGKPVHLLNNNILLSNDCTNNNNKDMLFSNDSTGDIILQGRDVVVQNPENNDTELEDLFFKVTGRRNDKFVSMLKSKFNPEDIKNKLQFFSEYIKTHEVKSPEGFIFDALRRDYEPNAPVVKKVRIPCKKCNGDGYFVDPKSGDVKFCSACKGTGRIENEPENLKKAEA